MITKQERAKDRAIAERVTKPLPWVYSTSNSHRWILSEGHGAVAYGTKLRDGCDDIVIDDRDGQHLANAANRLPAYIDALDEMERRIEQLKTIADDDPREAVLSEPNRHCGTNGGWGPDADYAAPWQVALREAPGASLCSDPDCYLSGGYAHVGPCEPCTCGKEHAAAECPDLVDGRRA